MKEMITLDDSSSEIANAISEKNGKPVDEVIKNALLLLAARVIKDSERKVA